MEDILTIRLGSVYNVEGTRPLVDLTGPREEHTSCVSECTTPQVIAIRPLAVEGTGPFSKNRNSLGSFKLWTGIYCTLLYIKLKQNVLQTCTVTTTLPLCQADISTIIQKFVGSMKLTKFLYEWFSHLPLSQRTKLD